MQNSPKWLFMESQSEVSRGRLIDSLNSLDHGLMIVSADGIVEYANSQAMHLADTHDIQGRPIADTLRLSDQAGNIIDMKSLLLHHKSQKLLLNIIHKDQIQLKINFSIAPIRSFNARPGGNVIILQENKE